MHAGCLFVCLFVCFNRDDPDYCGSAVSNASFSKIFGPGMRLGWMEVPTKVRDIILSSGLCNSGGAFNHTASGIMSSVIQLGLLEKMLAEARPIYQVRCYTILVLLY
jgi:DNA-binding transcriptional MocR family regulator